MSNYTSSLGFEQINPGDQAGLWGNTTNTNLSLIDQAISGVTPISFAGLSGSTYTLTFYNGAVDEARSAVLNITGSATGANTVVVPNVQKTYLVRNNTGQTIVFQTASPSATYSVLSGNSILIFCDGNNNVYTGIQSPSSGTLTVSGGGTGVTTFTAGFVTSPGGASNLTTTSTVSLSSQVSGTLPTSNGGTGSSSLTSNALLIGNGTGAIGTLLGGTSGQVATWNGSQWTAASPSSGVSSVSGSGNISVSPTTGSPVVSISSSPSFTSVSASSGMTIGGASVLTTTTGAQLSGAAFTGNISASSGSNIYTGTSGSTSYGGIFGSSVQLYNSSTSMYNNGSVFGFQTSSGTIVNINNTNGSFTNVSGSYTAFSDSRIKENITPARSYLADLQKLNVVNYNLVGRTDKYLGLIAQEVQAVMPGLVETQATNEAFPDVENLLSVKYSILVPMLLQAVQELNKKVTDLEAKVGA